jgi:hypothetical protein
VTKRAEQLQNDYEISKSPKLAEIISLNKKRQRWMILDYHDRGISTFGRQWRRKRTQALEFERLLLPKSVARNYNSASLRPPYVGGDGHIEQLAFIFDL